MGDDFGKYIRKKRLDIHMTLRDFCRRLEFDPSNWSKVERGELKPPTATIRLSKIADTLKLTHLEYLEMRNIAFSTYLKADDIHQKCIPKSKVDELIEELGKRIKNNTSSIPYHKGYCGGCKAAIHLLKKLRGDG